MQISVLRRDWALVTVFTGDSSTLTRATEIYGPRGLFASLWSLSANEFWRVSFFPFPEVAHLVTKFRVVAHVQAHVKVTDERLAAQCAFVLILLVQNSGQGSLLERTVAGTSPLPVALIPNVRHNTHHPYVHFRR
jgi:hypothetical protein